MVSSLLRALSSNKGREEHIELRPSQCARVSVARTVRRLRRKAVLVEQITVTTTFWKTTGKLNIVPTFKRLLFAMSLCVNLEFELLL